MALAWATACAAVSGAAIHPPMTFILNSKAALQIVAPATGSGNQMRQTPSAARIALREAPRVMARGLVSALIQSIVAHALALDRAQHTECALTPLV